MGEDGKEEQGHSQDALKKAQQALETPQKATAIATGDGIALDVHGILEVIDGMEQVPLANAQKGDVVWWKTKSGSSGCLLIDEPYKQEIGGYGSGDILISRGPEHPLAEQKGKGKIRGSVVGSMLKYGTVIKGRSIEFDLTEPNKPLKVYTSSPVVDMGIIKAAALNQA